MVDRVTDCWARHYGDPAHWCPGCGELHVIPISRPMLNGVQLTFDGNDQAPTITPSIRLERGAFDVTGPSGVCQYTLTGGIIQYAEVSTHCLAGRRVPLPQIPAIWAAYAR